MQVPTAFDVNGHKSYFSSYDISGESLPEMAPKHSERQATVGKKQKPGNSFTEQQGWRTQRMVEMIEHIFNHDDPEANPAGDDDKIFIRHFGSRTFGEPDEFKVLNDQIDNDIWSWKKAQSEAQDAERRNAVTKRREKQRKKFQTKMRQRYEDSLLRREPHAVKKLLEFLREGEEYKEFESSCIKDRSPSSSLGSENKSLFSKVTSPYPRTATPTVPPSPVSLDTRPSPSLIPPTPMINEGRNVLQRPKSAPVNLEEKRLRQLGGVQRYWESQPDNSLAQQHLQRLQKMQAEVGTSLATKGLTRAAWNPDSASIPCLQKQAETLAKGKAKNKLASTSRPRSATATLYKSSAALSSSLDVELLAPTSTLQELNEFEKRMMQLGLT